MCVFNIYLNIYSQNESISININDSINLNGNISRFLTRKYLAFIDRAASATRVTLSFFLSF